MIMTLFGNNESGYQVDGNFFLQKGDQHAYAGSVTRCDDIIPKDRQCVVSCYYACGSDEVSSKKKG